jgi:hypothetical protein
MRVRHIVEVERIGRGETGDDAGLLDSYENEWGPQHIQELHRKKEHPERYCWLRPLRRKAHPIVTHEHQVLSLTRRCDWDFSATRKQDC